MKVRDIMSYNVVTIPSNTSIADAKRIMTAHKIKRLPVVDKDKLMGIVTERGIEHVAPSKATSLSVWELSYLLEKTSVKEIMKKDLVTVDPNMDAEEVVALAQKNHVGSALVVEDDRIIGIVTNDDFFYKIINPLLGIDIPGTRIEIKDGIQRGKGAETMEFIMKTVHDLGLRITTIHIEGPYEKTPRDVCIHIDSDNVQELINKLKAHGLDVRIRNR
jgi:acetoin utilization protein AcuB